MFYYHIAEATYREDPEDYLEKALGSKRVVLLDQATAGKRTRWRFYLLFDSDLVRPMVAFGGSDKISHWASNVRRAINIPTDLYKDIDQKMEEWQAFLEEKNYGPIADFVGHSRGGDFVHQIKKDWVVFRITFNGSGCERAGGGGESYTLNLRIKNDLCTCFAGEKRGHLTIKNDHLGGPSKWEKVRQVPHRLRNFAQASTTKPDLVDKDWVLSPYPLEEISWQEFLPGCFADQQS